MQRLGEFPAPSLRNRIHVIGCHDPVFALSLVDANVDGVARGGAGDNHFVLRNERGGSYAVGCGNHVAGAGALLKAGQ